MIVVDISNKNNLVADHCSHPVPTSDTGPSAPKPQTAIADSKLVPVVGQFVVRISGQCQDDTARSSDLRSEKAYPFDSHY